MNFMQFARILWARRLLVLIAALASLFAGALVAKVTPYRYEATSRVLLDVARPDPVTGQNISAGFMRAYVKTQSELIRDYRVAGRVVDQLGWTRSPFYLAAYRSRPTTDRRDFRRWVAQLVIDGTKVQLADQSNILEISYRSATAESARMIADAIRQAYVDQTLSFKRDAAARNANWFEIQARQLRQQMTFAEQRKTAFERANGVMLQSDNVDVEEGRLKALAAAAGMPPTAFSGVVSSASVAPSAALLAQIDAQIAVATKTLGTNNPQMVALRQQRAAVASSAAQELAAARAAIPRAGPSGPSATAMYKAQQQKVLSQRDKVTTAQQLATDVEVLRDQFSKTSQRTAELRQEAATTEAGLTLLGSAVAASAPISPNVPLIIFGSAGMGLALGIAVALFVELLSRRIRGADDLEYIGVPVLGVMARDYGPSRFKLLSGLSIGQLRGASA
jgi:polysaccharide biosynthesis transport protein